MSEEHVNPVATSGERDKNEADSFNVTALIAEARRWANGHPNRRVSELIHGLVDALEAVTRERDAATEARIERWMQLVGKGVEERMTAEAERDAALAAIERLRSGLESASYYEYKPHKASSDLIWAVGEINAALDGAPEPEGRWEYRGRLQSCGYVAEGYISAEHAMNGLKVELEDHPYLQMDDTAIVERARVREWLPVEGEKP